MLPLFLAIFLLGLVAGLRAFTAPAVLWVMRHGGLWAVVLSILAIVEYAGDIYPKTPARTGAGGLIARLASGAFIGWSLATGAGASVAIGIVCALAGVLVGTYGGLFVRLKAIAAIGDVPSGIVEDLVAIGVAIAVVTFAPA